MASVPCASAGPIESASNAGTEQTAGEFQDLCFQYPGLRRLRTSIDAEIYRNFRDGRWRPAADRSEFLAARINLPSLSPPAVPLRPDRHDLLWALAVPLELSQLFRRRLPSRRARPSSPCALSLPCPPSWLSSPSWLSLPSPRRSPFYTANRRYNFRPSHHGRSLTFNHARRTALLNGDDDRLRGGQS
jgi:hypothetical protein